MTPAGVLDGLTLLRFAHAYESGGGTERYLDDLDRALLARSAATVVRLHLTRRTDALSATEERIGRGTLVRVPLRLVAPSSEAGSGDSVTLKGRLKEAFRDRVLYHPLCWRGFGARWTASRRLRLQAGQAAEAGATAAAMLARYPAKLAVLHYFGGADADEVLAAAQAAGVPVALLNHYSNDRFLHLAIRKHVMAADAIAGVNGLDVPPYLQGRVHNLSDGIDIEFFRREHARPLKRSSNDPIILLPARVIREKGQWDLIQAVARLHRTGLRCVIALAGRTDSSDFVASLQAEIRRLDLVSSVLFLGALDLAQLRDWYAASSAVALPTYHHEGLPRILLEAQAMGTPMVAYATGGVADGISEAKTGFLLRTGDLDGLTDRLRRIIESPQLRADLGAAGRQSAESRFSLSALADRHEQFYLKVIRGREKAGQGAPA
jgi:glycosyltransferase involved in cell wall biosynthesis